jgi:hypothetical protein
MIHYINTVYGNTYHLHYSTPSKYVEAVNKLDREWPVKTDDMFPYSNSPHAYWTGFYTSRPNKKSEVKKATSLKLASDLLFSQSLVESK